MFKYNEATHSIEELPEIKEPEIKGYTKPWDYHWDMNRYNDHIASLKTYNIPKEYWEECDSRWKDGDILGEKDFKIVSQWARPNDRMNEWNFFKSVDSVEVLKKKNYLIRTVAIPIEQNKEVTAGELFKAIENISKGAKAVLKVEEEKEKEDEADKAANEYGTKIHYPGEAREWKQKLIGDKATSFKDGWMACKNNLVECKEKDQDELWNEILELFYEQDCGIDKLREQFSISKK